MKNHAHARRAGFTLVELLTVISIIVILATLMIASFGYFKRRQAEDKTRMQVKLLENGLEQYKLDNGFYPPATLAADGKATETFTNADGTAATHDLYMALYGNGLANNSRIYLAELDPSSLKQGWIDLTKGADSLTLIDAFGHEYRYRKLADKTQQKNPEFDLWSAGFDGKTDVSGAIYNPNSKENRDDIW